MQTKFTRLTQATLAVLCLGISACSTPSTAPGSPSASTTANAPTNKTPSATIRIDETQIMWMVGGDIGGGTLSFQGQSYGFKMDGLKLGGFGVHKVELDGDVWDLSALDDFPGIYGAAEVGYTVADSGKGDVWLQNKKGVKLRLKSPESKGLALSLGVDGIDIRLD
jgi:hypothetical protein